MLSNPAGEFERALWHTLALWFNLASDKLSFWTPVDYPQLTAATTVGEAVAEIEALILMNEELERAKDIADAINNGWALDCAPGSATPPPAPTMTAIPPTAVPPTEVPPTEIPPTVTPELPEPTEVPVPCEPRTIGYWKRAV